MEGKKLTLFGKEVHYFAQRASQDTVLFIHGDGQNHTSGTHILNQFPNWTKISYDRPGHGKSEELTDRTLEQEAQIAAQILGQARKTILIGHSGGAAVAIKTALIRPVTGLILIEAFFQDPRTLFDQEHLKKLEHGYLERAKANYTGADPHNFSEKTTEQEIHQAVFASTPPKTLERNLNLYAGYNVCEQISTLGIPILIIQTQEGPLSTYEHVQQATQGNQKIHLRTIKPTHNPHIIHKKEIEDIIQDELPFLAS